MAESITDPNPKSKAKAKDTKGASEHVHSCLLFKANGFPYKSVFYEKLQLELAGRIESINRVVIENRKRHTNSDAAFQNICTFMDLIYGQQDKQFSCCYVLHKDDQYGHFLTCLSNTDLDHEQVFNKNEVGKCDTSTPSCGGSAKEF